MDDELEDKIIYQTYSVHMKLLSKLAVDFSLLNVNTYFSYLLHIMRFYVLKPEFIFIGTLIFVLIYFLIANQANNRSLLQKIQDAFGHTTTNVSNFQLFINKNLSDGIKLTWESKQEYIAAYAVQGHRAHMEDRFVINTNINNTGVSLFAIFDGHGGEFAANYARDNLVPSIKNKVIQLKNMLDGKIPKVDPADTEIKEELNQNEIKENKNEENLKNRKKSFRKTISTDDYKKKSFDVTDSTILEKLDSLKKTITREVRPTKPEDKIPVKVNLSSYLDGDKINYSKLLFDEVLAIDRLIVEEAKKNMDVAGTTALIALLEGNKLIVANVGDSRGVMCDGKGNVIPLSFDHKPQQQRERIRINKAGGLVIFNGVWRVAGILATSRALGDYPLKDKKLVIAEPDILTFDLVDHNPMFFILATDGLWDTFSNEEAVSYIKNHINEPYYGAKSITLQSYYRGSLDNITVLVINLRDRTNYFESVKK